jgi:hypothetical protein
MSNPCVISAALAMAFILFGCAAPPDSGTGQKRFTYRVERLKNPMAPDADWDKSVWRSVKPLELTHHMGPRPEHFPRVQAKMLYDDAALYLIWRVEDRFVRALAKKHQDSVCVDSCVEFFFTPGDDPVADGYFNLEMNCGGIMLFNYQLVPWKNQVGIEDLGKIQIAHSMPATVDPERTEPTTWTVQYRLPISILDTYFQNAKRPAPGVTWRANFYKCADATSHPHWLTWAPVDLPRPDFHQPKFFGILEFDG